MWKMFEDTIDCCECTYFRDPPPKFEIPPPPRPPYIGTPSNCKEKVMSLKIQKAWDHDKCEAIPIFDTSFYKRQSLQTSAVIAVFCLLFILVALILSLFVCKNKRKVQNVLPCKELIRVPHINGTLPIVGAHSVTHEVLNMPSDHQRPLVMLHHHNVEVIHPKGAHYPNEYTMTRSPPFLISSSPGPDPYRSNDNVYEELGPCHGSDDESVSSHSDDIFGGDDFSLSDERSVHKSSTLPYIEVNASNYKKLSSNCNSTYYKNGTENSSILPSPFCTSSHIYNQNTTNQSNSGTPTSSSNGNDAGTFINMLHHATGRNKFHLTKKNRSKPKCENTFSLEYPESGRYLSPYYISKNTCKFLRNSQQWCNIPLPLDRRHPCDVIEPTRVYTHHISHRNYNYESSNKPPREQQQRLDSTTFVMHSYLNDNHMNAYSYKLTQNSHTYQHPTQPGYSYNTPTSSIRRYAYDVSNVAIAEMSHPTKEPYKASQKLAAELNFTSWKRRRANTEELSEIQSIHTTSNNFEATSQKNNNASSTVTSKLDNSLTSNAGIDTSVFPTTSTICPNNNSTMLTLAAAIT